jgi:hypothetical protein
MAKKDNKLFESKKAERAIITNTMDYLLDGSTGSKIVAIEAVKTLAKYYNVTLRNKIRPLNPDQIRTDLKAFIHNSEGYNIALNNLYQSLNNCK